MNKYYKASVLCLVLSIVFFTAGVLSNEIEVGIFIIFPFLKGSGIYALLGFVFILIAILLFIFGFGRTTIQSYDLQFGEDNVQKKKSVKGGGVVLIGPIPIIFGSNWKIAVLMMILAIILVVVVFTLF